MPHRRDEGSGLTGITVVWIGLLVFLAFGYVFRTPPGGPYTDAMLRAFTVVLAIVVPLFSAVMIVAWVVVLRDRRP